VEVLFLAGRVGPDDHGGPITALMDRLRRRGVLARLICSSRGSSPSGDPRVLELPGLERRWFRMAAIRQNALDAGFEHPCVLHVLQESMAATGLALADSIGLPYVLTVDEFELVERGLKLSRRWFRELIATSPELIGELVEELGFPADRVSFIAPGFAFSASDPQPAERRIPVIGTAGTARPNSGFAIFLEAARNVLETDRDAEFLIGSQGGDAQNLRRHAQSLGIADRVSVADFSVIGPPFWSVLDIYCQPALSPSTGRALARALCEGVPSITTPVKGLRSLIDHGSTGLIVPPGNPDALAAAIMELLDHPVKARFLGGRSRETTQPRFDAEKEADLLATVYRRHAALPAHVG
jgi:glycosyltransferase involved in cell wall biosynthesis